jgi:dTDP-glucose pyrophosphorylase
MIKKKFFNPSEIAPIIIPDALNVEQSLRVMDEQGMQILLVTNDNKELIGIVTDSDLRRAVLRGVQLSDQVENLVQKKFKSVLFADWQVNPSLCDQSGYNHIPVLDAGNHIAGLLMTSSERADQNLEVPVNKTPVVVMAGGAGTRLAPFTNILPKPMLPVGDSTVLEKILSSFFAQGFRDFYIILNYKKDLIRAYFADAELPFQLTFIDETMPLGTAGGLSLLSNKINGKFILSNADIISDIDFVKAVDWHQENDSLATIISVEKVTSVPYGIVDAKENGYVLNISEKPEIKHQIISGLYIFDSEIFQFIPSKEHLDMDHLLKTLIKENQKVMTYNVSNNWLDMGEFSEYKEFLKFFGTND